MAPLCHIELPSHADALLRQVAERAVGSSLVSDRADVINHLQTHGAGLPKGPATLKRYATLLVGAAVSLREGWSMLPPGLASEVDTQLPKPPRPSEWTDALGGDEADSWMTLAVWVGCEFTAQRALPLPRMIGVALEEAELVNAKWNTLGEACLAPAVALYRDQAFRMAIGEPIRRAAAALAVPNAHFSGPGSELWGINRQNRFELARALARRDPALVGDMFALERGMGETKGSWLLRAPEHLAKERQLHNSALGIFELEEWPLHPEVISGSDMTIARQALRRNILAFAGEWPHLREFAVKSGLIQEGPWMKNPHSWELAAALLTTPTEPGGPRSTFATQQSARALASHFTHSGVAPTEYLEFRDNALCYNQPQNAIAQLIRACDSMVVDGWAQEEAAARYFIEQNGDREERRSVLARLEAVSAAQQKILSVGDRIRVLRQCLNNALALQDGNLATNTAGNIAPLAHGSEREELAQTLVAVLRQCQALTPDSVGRLCRNDLVSASAVIEARLHFRLHGEGLCGNLDFGLTSQEKAGYDSVRSDLASVRGLYYVEHRMLSILETGARAGHCPDPSVLALVAKYDSGGTAKGREKELRALFALIAARDHERSDLADGEDSYVMAAAEAAPNLREARKALAVSGQLSQEERIMRLLTDATDLPASRFAAGVAAADPTVLNTLHDAHQAKTLLAFMVGNRATAKRVINYAIREYAQGQFQTWKYTHHLSKRQLAGAPPDLVARWREDRAWHGATLGQTLSVRESSDFGELLRHGDYPVKTCYSLLNYGKEAGAGLSVLADSFSKLIQFIDPGSHRVVGRSIVRLLYSRQRSRPVILMETPYTMANTQANMAMRLIGLRALADKYGGAGVFVLAGLSAADREKGLIHEAERHMGRMSTWPLAVPESMASQQYFDSALQQTPNDDGTFEMCCLPEAVQMTRDAVVLRPLPGSLCRKDPPSLLTANTVEDEDYAARCRLVLPDATERESFFASNPDIRVSGTLPRGHEVRWRECLAKFPRLAEHLHHSEAVQSLLGGAPDPAGDGADVRRALSIVEGRSHFRGLIQGLSRREIAAARGHWLGILSSSMDRDPSRWPPEIDYQQIASDVRAALTALAQEPREAAFAGTDDRRMQPLGQPSKVQAFEQRLIL